MEEEARIAADKAAAEARAKEEADKKQNEVCLAGLTHMLSFDPVWHIHRFLVMLTGSLVSLVLNLIWLD